MKLSKRRALAFCMCVVVTLLGLVSGCKKDEGDGSLTIAFYNGGYGTEWAEVLFEKFSEENDGVIINPKPDNQLLTTLTADLSNRNNKVDLYFSHGITWERYAAEGLIEPLDDLYSWEDDGVKFEDRVVETARNASKYANSYYKVPWTQGAGGIIYNVKMFKEYGWEVPETYQELMDLCHEIVARDLKTSRGKTVAPFIWAGNDSWLLDYLVFEWWGQLAGTDKIAQLMKYENAEVFNPESGFAEFKKAYQYWYDMFALNPEFSVAGSFATDKFTAQSEFVTGSAAMMVNAHWLYNETKKSAMPGFEMAMFPAPKLPDAKAGYEKVNFSVGFGDSIILSKNSKNKELAKKFLQFLSREENCLLFSEYVPGTSLAFEYDMKQAATDNVFAQSVADVLNDCISFNIYSSSPLVIIHGSEVIGPWPANTYYYRDSCQDKDKYTATYVFDTIYNYCKTNWKNWKDGAGIS